jgi:hypothetical protein
MDPGWVKIKIRIRDEHPGSYFRELGNHFLMQMRIQNSGSGIFLTRIRNLFYLRSGMENILDPGFGINIPDPHNEGIFTSDKSFILIRCKEKRKNSTK